MNVSSDIIKDVLETLLDNIMDVIIITDKDGKITWVNKGFQQLTFYKIEEVLGKKPGEFLQGPDTDPNTIKLIGDSIKLLKDVQTDILNYDKYGRQYWLRMHIIPTYKNGMHTGFVAIEHNLTDQYKKTKSLEYFTKKYQDESNKKNKILTIISHDIFNMIQTTINIVEILLATEKSDVILKYLTYIKKNSESIQMVLKGILDNFNYVDQKEELDLEKVIENCVKFINTRANVKNLLINKNLVKCKIFGNYSQMVVIFNNILTNAVKYTHNEGKIDISMELTVNKVKVIIQDNGVGMSKNKLSKIFKLEQHKESIEGTNGEKGSGIGLLFTKELVEKNDGMIFINSEENNGTIITIIFDRYIHF
jgi:PAS domain S-box-containing protein